MKRTLFPAALCTLLLAGCTTPATHQSPWAGMNVLWISFDSVRSDHCSFSGYEKLTTPNLDRLANAAGIVFPNCIAQAPYTLPSYASMLTSRWVSDLVVKERHDQHEGKLVSARTPGPDATDLLLSEVLQRHGYRTAGFMQNWLGPGFGFDQGWDHFRYRREALVDKIGPLIDWIDQPDSRPFFAFVYTTDPHYPYLHFHEARSSVKAAASGFQIDDTTIESVRNGSLVPSADDLATEVARYDEGIRLTDEDLEPLLDHLEARQLMKRTIVVFNADHGEEFFEHRIIGHGQTYYEPTVRVPLLIAAPGIQPRRIDRRVRNLDIAPTILAMLGLPGEPSMRGKDLSPWFAGVIPHTDGPAFSEGAFTGWVGSTYWRQRKLILRGDGTPELYDLELDPGELHDQASNRPDIVQALRRRLLAHMALSDKGLETLLTKDTSSLLREILDARRISPASPEYEELKALGYVQ